VLPDQPPDFAVAFVLAHNDYRSVRILLKATTEPEARAAKVTLVRALKDASEDNMAPAVILENDSERVWYAELRPWQFQEPR
jgi:hypothetical protein